MKISIIGTNGLISDSFGRYCNINNILLDMYGLLPPKHHQFDSFYPVNLIKEDLDYEKIVQSDVIIFAAGAGIQSSLKESDYLIYEINVFAPVKICNSLKHAGYSGAFISFGSYFEIGENSENHCFTEKELLESQNRMVNDYSISKRMFSRFISSIELPFKKWHFILPTVFGENESPHRLIPYTINAIKTKTEIEFTSGEQIRQYVYVDEVAEIIIRAYKSIIDSGVYNVSGAETLTVKELVQSIFNAFHQQLPVSVFNKIQRLDTGMKNLQLDGSKLIQAINYQPSIKISEVYGRY